MWKNFDYETNNTGQFIFSDDWNDTMFITLKPFGNDVIISLKSRPLTFVYLYTRTKSIQKQIVKYHKKGKYPEYLTIDKVGN